MCCMKKIVELPFGEPLLTTYHRHITVGICLYGNPTLINWYLNKVANISCNSRFLSGFTTPSMDIENAIFHDCSYLHKWWYPMRFAKGHINAIIRELIDDGYYVYFQGVDDYYLENKSFYKKQHFEHDGMIVGYDQENKTYSVYAYDERWVCRKFKISQKSFNQGWLALFKKGIYGNIFGIKPKKEKIEFNPREALCAIQEYLDSSMEKYPPTSEGMIYGIAVQEYLAMYLSKLLDGSIPYERMDRRVLRLLWEHKRLMKMRIQKIEEIFSLDSEISTQYDLLEKEADRLRMLYATYSMKKRDALLMTIRTRLIQLNNKERKLLEQLIEKTKGVIEL